MIVYTGRHVSFKRQRSLIYQLLFNHFDEYLFPGCTFRQLSNRPISSPVSLRCPCDIRRRRLVVNFSPYNLPWPGHQWPNWEDNGTSNFKTAVTELDRRCVEWSKLLCPRDVTDQVSSLMGMVSGLRQSWDKDRFTEYLVELNHDTVINGQKQQLKWGINASKHLYNVEWTNTLSHGRSNTDIRWRHSKTLQQIKLDEWDDESKNNKWHCSFGCVWVRLLLFTLSWTAPALLAWLLLYFHF